MATDFYRLTGPAPCDPGDVVQIGPQFYHVSEREPLYYPFQNIVAGVNIGFITGIFPVPDLVPAKQTIHYLTGWGINGGVQVQIRYQSGAPRNTVGARSAVRLDRNQANYLIPFTDKLAVVSGDTLELDVLADFANVLATIWFYGWKLYVSAPLKESPESKVVVLEDMRQI